MIYAVQPMEILLLTWDIHSVLLLIKAYINDRSRGTSVRTAILLYRHREVSA